MWHKLLYQNSMRILYMHCQIGDTLGYPQGEEYNSSKKEYKDVFSHKKISH